MGKENNSDRAKITYEEFKNIRSMLSASDSDKELAISILSAVDQKQALPYILFILMELAYVKDDRSLLWRLYSKIPICKNLGKIINPQTIYGKNPYDYTDPDTILKLIEKEKDPMIDSYNKSYLDRIIHSMTINQITDAILVQENPREYFPLEVDITEMVLEMFDLFQTTHTAISKSAGLVVKFDVENAIDKRSKNAKQK
jgi:hypothetical protein